MKQRWAGPQSLSLWLIQRDTTQIFKSTGRVPNGSNTRGEHISRDNQTFFDYPG